MPPDVLPIRTVAADPPAPPAVATLAPLVVDARRLAPLLSISVRTLRCWDAAGKMPAPVRVSGAVRWRLDEIKAWILAGCPDRAIWEACREAAWK